MLPLCCWTRIGPAFENSVDPDHLASEEANWSGSTLFAIKYLNLYRKQGCVWNHRTPNWPREGVYKHKKVSLNKFGLNNLCNVKPLCGWTRIGTAFENSADPDHLASEEANWSGSTLFAIKYLNLYQQPELIIWLAINWK